MIEHQLEVGFLAVVLQLHRGVVGLAGLFRPAAGELYAPGFQKRSGNGLCELLALFLKKGVFLKENESAVHALAVSAFGLLRRLFRTGGETGF